MEEIKENFKYMICTSSVKRPYIMLGITHQQNVWLNCSPEAEKLLCMEEKKIKIREKSIADSRRTIIN